MEVKKATVILLIDKNDRVCLARKKQPIHHEDGEISYSLGMYNGYGGKKEEGDVTIEDTAIRELFDESGVQAKKEDLVAKGAITFLLCKKNKEEPFMEVFFYELYEWIGFPEESLEMGEPIFFSKETLPYHEMMPADKVIFENLFQGKNLAGEVVLFGKDAEPVFRLI